MFGSASTAELGGPHAGLALALPVLAGPDHEDLLRQNGARSVREDCTLFETGDEVAGFAVAAPAPNLEAATRHLYHRMLTATRGRKLYRVWNYVPHINAVEQGLENYRGFCRARSLAFEDHFGLGYQRQLPAASAVGTAGGLLAVAFLAGDREPRHFENPRQVPAFEYPAVYGPRAPSFSRATLVTGASGQQLYVSGTAAIRGHMTIAAGDLRGQLTCTRENLATIAQTAGAGEDFGARDGWQRTLKVYIRHASDVAVVRSDLERHLLRRDDRVTYLHADVCRADLLVEIEAILTRA